MITVLFRALKNSLVYVKDHPQVLFALTLLIVLPLLFVYTGNQFLEVGRANQDRLGKDRVGLMHDVFTSLLRGTDFNTERVHAEFTRTQESNNDFIDYALVKKEGSALVYLSARDAAAVGGTVEDTTLYVNAALRNDESLIFEFYDGEVRYWAGYRAVESDSGELYFLYTLFSLEALDSLFEAREKSAYYSLVFVYVFLIGLAYFHIRITDYRYLFMKAQQASRMKDLYTNTIAHELRSPLTAIKGYANMLTEKLTEKTTKEEASRIEASADRLLGIVNDLLDIARIESGKLSIEKTEGDIVPVIIGSLDELKALALLKKITFKTEGFEVPHVLNFDEKRMAQAFTNLVSNAIKYSQGGTITVSIEDKHASLEVRVKDTGMGISADDQAKLFAPFFRAEDTDVSKITGTGLGMWITKQLIELQGGKVGVESIKGVGTHVVVSLPKEIRL